MGKHLAASSISGEGHLGSHIDLVGDEWSGAPSGDLLHEEAAGIVEIAEDAALGEARPYAGRLLAPENVGLAQVALLDDALRLVQLPGAVGTQRHAVAAADADIRVHHHDAALVQKRGAAWGNPPCKDALRTACTGPDRT